MITNDREEGSGADWEEKSALANLEPRNHLSGGSRIFNFKHDSKHDFSISSVLFKIFSYNAEPDILYLPLLILGANHFGIFPNAYIASSPLRGVY